MFKDNPLLIIFLSVLIIVFVIQFYKAIKNYKRFECPKCGHKQNNSKEMHIDKYNYIDHGRKTITGKLDRRFNTTFSSNKIIHYQVECEGCGYSYEHIYDRMQEKIDNDPVIKQLNQELADINKAAEPRIRAMKKRDPRMFKKMQDLGLISKDFK